MNERDTLELIKRLSANGGKPKQVWIEAWYVQDHGQISWRATMTEQPNDLQKKIALWTTHFLFVGKTVIVSFYSSHNMPREYALSVCETIISGKVIYHEIDLTKV